MKHTQNYWRFDYGSDDRLEQILASPTFDTAKNRLARLKPGHVIVLAQLNYADETAEVVGVGIVASFEGDKPTVEWRRVKKILRPTISGITRWKDYPWFKFPGYIAKGYDLDGLVKSAFKK